MPWTLVIITALGTTQLSATSLATCRQSLRVLYPTTSIQMAYCSNPSGDLVTLIPDCHLP